MAIAKFINLFAAASLAVLVCSFGASPVTALVTDSHVMARHVGHGHGGIAKRKRSSGRSKRSSGRCKPRPAAAAANATEAVSSTLAAATSQLATVSAAAPPKQTSAPASNSGGSTSSGSNSSSNTNTNNGNGSSGGSGGGNTSGLGGPKVGIAWPNGNDPSLPNFKTSHTQNLYTWSPFCPDNAKELGFNCMPMLWSDAPDKVAQFQQTVVPGYANIAMGFNECNEVGQSNMSPQDAAASWKKYIQPLKAQGYKLISPSTSSNPNGKQWTSDFFAACGSECTFDGISVHYYDVTPQGFIDYVNDFHDTFNLDIWPTEFACQNFNNGPQCTQPQIENFFSTIIKFMDATPWIPHYFAFGVMQNLQGVNPGNGLMASSGQPTALGSQYINDSW